MNHIGTFTNIQGENPYEKEDEYLKIEIDNTPSTYRLSNLITQIDTYTFSVWIKADSNCNVTLNILGTSIIESVTNEWNKVTKTVTVSNLNFPHIDITPDINSVTYYYEGYLVKGSIDTSWNPAPEDAESSLSTLESNIARLEITAEGIRQMVESNYVTKDEAGNLINSSMTSVIEQTAEMIESSVTDNITGANSYVNQKFDSITQTVTDLSGNITEVTQNVESINQKVEDVEGNMSSFQQTAEEIHTEVENMQGQVSSIKQTADGLQSQITDNKNNISQLEQNVEGFKTTVSSQLDSMETNIQQTTEAIELSASKIEELENKKVVTSSTPYFYLSDSNTQLVGGSWATSPPGWSEGKYYWQKTVTTYSDGSTVESTPICITGNKGSDGTGVTILGSYDSEEELKQAHPTGNPGDAYMIAGDLYVWDAANSQWKNVGRIQGEQGDAGPAGKSIVSVTVEFYLSTSKTTQTGGSWSETVPTWENGKYLWTRTKIVYENPSSTEYTTPVCDSSWEAANEVADDLHNNYYNKTETEALISVESDRITSTVKETVVETVSEEVGNIQIGGRNLAEKTNQGITGWSWVRENEGTIVEEVLVDNVRAVKLSRDEDENKNGGGWSTILYSYIAPQKYEALQKYILSFDILSTVETTGTCVIANSDGTGVLTNYFGTGDIPSNQWTKISVIFTVVSDLPEVGQQVLNISGINSDANVSYTIKNLKIEKGTVGSDWTPAPEDVTEEVQNAQTSADEANATANSNESRVTVAESTIQQLSDAISTLVVDENGSSMMTQTSDGWRFDMGSINSQLNNTQDKLNEMSGELTQVDETINNLNDLASDLSEKTAYISMTTDDNGDPCIELGNSTNDFKVRITNTSIDFMGEGTRIAYLNNNSLYIEKAIIKNELQIGEGEGFIWKTRSNGHMGLRWYGGDA